MSVRRLDNWIQAYLAFTHSSESPEVYHKWVALSVLSGAITRRVVFNMGYFLLYPNLYTVLIGPAGRCKKSTAMRIGRGLLSEVPGANFTTDSVTRERLILDLSQTFKDGQSAMTAYSTEFATLLTSSGMDMVVFLTDIYDSQSEWSHASKTGGKQTIKGPYLNLMGATTPDWVSKAMPLDTVGIGLTSRIIFVYEDTPRVRPAFPRLTSDQLYIRQMLIEDLIAISNVAGEYSLAPDAEIAYDEGWYQKRIENPNPTGDERLNGYFERKPMHLLKVAMLLAASRRDETIVTVEDLEAAQILLTEVEEKMPQVFASLGKNPLAVDYTVIGKVISDTGGVSFANLMDMYKHNVRKEEMAEILETLVSTGAVIPESGNIYRPNREFRKFRVPVTP